jgi:hypothetical protein
MPRSCVDSIEEAQRTDRLVQRRPRDPGRDQMDLEGSHILQIQPARRVAKIAAELRDGVNVGSLRRRHRLRTVMSSAMRRRRGLISAIGGLSCPEGWASTPTILSDGRPSLSAHPTPAVAGSFNPFYEFMA